MRKILGVGLLVLLLSGSAGAGIMGNDDDAPPPQTTAQEPTSGETIGGEIPTPDISDSLAQTILEVLVSVLP